MWSEMKMEWKTIIELSSNSKILFQQAIFRDVDIVMPNAYAKL